MNEANIEKDSHANFCPENSVTWCGERRKDCFLRRVLWKMFIYPITILAFFLPPHPVWADSGPSAEGQGCIKSFLVSLEYGWAAKFTSSRKYENHHKATLALSREWEFGSILLHEKHGFVESLLTELRLSRIWGNNIPLKMNQVSQEYLEKAQQQGREPTVDWDHYQLGITPFYRLYYPLSNKTRPYAEIGVGFVWLDKPLVYNGTNWSFSLIAGFGIKQEIHKIPFFAFLRAEHNSNAGNFFNLKETNIGVETAVLGVGVSFH